MTMEGGIPSPPGWPLVGNIADLDMTFPLGSLMRLSETYGEIYRLYLPGRKLVVVTSYRLVAEACDEKRFKKDISAPLREVRNGVHDGLFTAHDTEWNWGLAHRVLTPPFGPLSIEGMFDEMHDVATQLVMKWARHGPDSPIMVTEDVTRLALDTLALCSMNYRMNSFYRDEMHPFVKAMGDFLMQSAIRSRRPPLPSFFYRDVDAKYEKDIEAMRKTANDLLKARKEHPTEKQDLMNAMLKGVDPQTGDKMSDDSITDNLITFLIAGHETSSGLVSFAFYYLLKNHEAYKKLQQEVDEVIGTQVITVQHLANLPYVNAVLRETLRLSASIPGIWVRPIKDEILGGKYAIGKDESVSLILGKSQCDPEIFGDTGSDFLPDRMLDENFRRLNKEFPNFWKPFGNGSRACIGRDFAWQEAVLLMAMLFQNFDFRLHDPSYELKIKQTMTIKPKDFFIHASLRNGLTPTQLQRRLNGSSAASDSVAASPAVATKRTTRLDRVTQPLMIYYGSNSGTCKSLAQRLASHAIGHGFNAAVVDAVDAAVPLPQGNPIAIIIPSYEGEPPDNAVVFCKWLQGLEPGSSQVHGVPFAVFGCGHHDWTETFHKVPIMIDSTLQNLGGQKVIPLGLADAAEGDISSAFEAWEDALWSALQQQYKTDNRDENNTESLGGLDLEISNPRPEHLQQDGLKAAVVAKAYDLTGPGAPNKKRHIDIRLPEDLTYSVGDYVDVLPTNPLDLVRRVLRRFSLNRDSLVTIRPGQAGNLTLPADYPLPASTILESYVELNSPATRRDIKFLMSVAVDQATVSALLRLSEDDFDAEIIVKRTLIIDLLERFQVINLTFGGFLGLLSPLRLRQYSISSSPTHEQQRLSLTVSVLNEQGLVGIASTYLAGLEAGDILYIALRPSHFKLPSDEDTPLIMVAAGSGLAPFRGFIDERAKILEEKNGHTALAPAVLFFGCRHPGWDDLYRDELDNWEASGAIAVQRSYSRKAEATEGCAHVQDRLWQQREVVGKLWNSGANLYVCGSRAVAHSVKSTVVRILVDIARQSGQVLSSQDAAKQLHSLQNQRYFTDIFD